MVGSEGRRLFGDKRTISSRVRGLWGPPNAPESNHGPFGGWCAGGLASWGGAAADSSESGLLALPSISLPNLSLSHSYSATEAVFRATRLGAASESLGQRAEDGTVTTTRAGTVQRGRLSPRLAWTRTGRLTPKASDSSRRKPPAATRSKISSTRRKISCASGQVQKSRL